jgi:aryl-alcohol dehydrogenase-like predicted oxidoreductase
MTAIPMRAIPGLPEPVARVALGTSFMGPRRRDASFELLDALVELGGTLVDTAARYGDGGSERVIGAWLRARPAAARRVVLLTKGAHPDPATWRPRLNVRELREDIDASLERLGVDRVHIYLVHRDDPRLPVPEIVDMLDEQVRAGRTLAIGVSNWTPDRLREAVAYAASSGRAPIALTSEYLGLADADHFPWDGCVSARDDETLAWHVETGIPLLAWSSQSGGWFAPGFDETATPDIRAAYDTPANRARRERAVALATGRGLTAQQVALAWTLSAPAAPIAVVGVRDAAGLATAFETLHVALSPAERAWLDRGEGGMP